MKNKDILDEFGKIVIEDIYDDGLNFFDALSTGTTKWGTDKEYTEVLQRMPQEDQKILRQYIVSVYRTSIFGFLDIFETREQFKIIHHKNGKQTDLVEISEMLKAEIHGEEGWIARFSKFNNKG